MRFVQLVSYPIRLRRALLAWERYSLVVHVYGPDVECPECGGKDCPVGLCLLDD